MAILLDDDVMRSFKVAKEFRQVTSRINDLEFSTDGNWILTYNADNEIVVYDAQKAQKSRSINVKKYGVDLVSFADPNSSTVVHSSTKEDNVVRYLSLFDNKYIHYFKGHTNKVVSLCVSPNWGTFVSGTSNESLILWDLRSHKCQNQINVTGRPVTAFNPEGSVLAVGENSETIKFFDIRSFHQPFATNVISQGNESDWTDIQYSPDGQTILIPTNGSLITLFDIKHCTTIYKFTDYQNENRMSVKASFSPDSLYVLSTSTDGIHVWNSFTGEKLCMLNSDCPCLVHNIKFNPKFMMLASICTNKMVFWVPPPSS